MDAAIRHGGSYYLPYQPHATPAQFHAAYPRAGEYFALKRQLDPARRFRNALWDRYDGTATDAAADSARAAQLAARPGYARPFNQTFLTHPEWTLVYISDAYAAWLRTRPAHDYPYAAAVGQFWRAYGDANRLTKGDPLNAGYHVMLLVIGTSTAVEYALKSLYENTIGRFTAWTAGGTRVPEEEIAFAVADDYARFIHVTPWYDYDFTAALGRLWRETPLWGSAPLRRWERKGILTLEFAVKAVYGALIRAGTRTAYDPEAAEVQLVLRSATLPLAAPLRVVDTLPGARLLVAVPRYDRFREALTALAARDTSAVVEAISGNEAIFVTGTAPVAWRGGGRYGRVASAYVEPDAPDRQRVSLTVPVDRLLAMLRRADAEGQFRPDHLYDF